MHKGRVVYCGDDWDELEKYGSTKKTRPVEVDLWSIERSSVGYMLVTYADGAIGKFMGDTSSNLSAYVRTIEGWPTPRNNNRPLPREALMMYEGEEPAPVEEEQEQDSNLDTEENVNVRVRRRRTAVESGTQKHIRRVRPAH